MSFFDDRYAKVDNTLIEDGAKIDFGGGFFVTIRHVSAKKVETTRSQKMKQLRVMNRNRDLTPEQNKELMHHVTAYAGIVTWEGGDAPPFTPEFAIQVFNERPEFLEDVMTAMTTYEAFRSELVEDAVGNSPRSSSGASASGNTSKPSSSTKPKDEQ